jgi:hypothetical protein
VCRVWEYGELVVVRRRDVECARGRKWAVMAVETRGVKVLGGLLWGFDSALIETIMIKLLGLVQRKSLVQESVSEGGMHMRDAGDSRRVSNSPGNPKRG